MANFFNVFLREIKCPSNLTYDLWAHRLDTICVVGVNLQQFVSNSKFSNHHIHIESGEY